MTKLSKSIYITMVIVAIITIVTSLVTKDYINVMNQVALMCWIGVAFMYEKRCIKLQKQIDETNGYN